MAKRDLSGGLQSLLQRKDPKIETSSTEELKATIKDPELKEALEDEETLRSALRSKRFAGGRPKKGETRESKTKGYGRTCIVINEEKLAKIKEIGFRETLTLKEIFEAMMDNLIKTYEAKHGEITPTDHSGDANKLYD